MIEAITKKTVKIDGLTLDDDLSYHGRDVKAWLNQVADYYITLMERREQLAYQEGFNDGTAKVVALKEILKDILEEEE